MAYRTGTADDYRHLLSLLRSFVRGWATETGRSYTGTGNGFLRRFNVFSNVAQTWTITFTSATAATVSGSVSGAQGSATVGTLFSNSVVELLLVAGGTAFQSGDVFTVTVSASSLTAGDIWTEERWVSNYGTSDPWELILRGQGDGTDEIYVGVKTAFNTTGNWYNWKLGGFTGFLTGNSFETQPGYSGESVNSPVHVPLWDSTIPFWFMVNGRRICMLAQVSTVFESLYLGFINTFASPNQFPYPLLVGGSLAFRSAPPVDTSPNWRWSSTANDHSMFHTPIYNLSSTSPGQRSTCRLRMPNGAWRDIFCLASDTYSGTAFTSNNAYISQSTVAAWAAQMETAADRATVWPSIMQMNAQAPCIDGTYQTWPMILLTGPEDGDSAELVGEIDGLRKVSGVGLSALDTITEDGVAAVVAPNTFRTTIADYAAWRLE